MLHTQKRTGFTLIELLVVITIIGILATGAVTVYTSQIQKARDTTRIRDVDALKGAAEQVYQDESEYPTLTNFGEEMQTYIKILPRDGKHGSSCNGIDAFCAYAYGVGPDENTIDNGAYEFSTAFENEGNRTKKAANDNDNGDDPVRFETGLIISGAGAINTVVGEEPAETRGACAANGVLIINGNSGVEDAQCASS